MPALYKPRSTVRWRIQGVLSALQERQSQYEVVQAVHPRPIVYSVNRLKVGRHVLFRESVSGPDSTDLSHVPSSFLRWDVDGVRALDQRFCCSGREERREDNALCRASAQLKACLVNN